MNLLIIRNLCKSNEVSMRSVASYIGMSEQNFHRCIKTNKIDAETLHQIAQFFHISINDFFDEDAGAIFSNNENYLLKEYKRENELLKELVNEKERTIQILMKKE